MSEIKYCDLFNIRTKIGVNQSERLVFMCRKEISKGSEITTQNELGLFEELEKQDNLGIEIRNFERDFETIEEPIHAQEGGRV